VRVSFISEEGFIVESPFLKEISQYDKILLTGAGGGFDIYSGVPLFEYLKSRGKQVWLGSLSFAELRNPDGDKLKRDFLKVVPDTPGNDWYFPERCLSRWYADKGEDVPVYAYYGSGARSVLRIFEELRELLGFEALVLVDGGTDSLMRGDEPGLGSPAEDIVSISAGHMLEGVDSFLLSLGYGVDYYHEVCHHYVLEAIADMTKTGDFLGAFSLLPGMAEFETFVQLVKHSNGVMPGRESIVATSVVAAGQGFFGNFHPTDRTEGRELYINPLMCMYFCFRLKGVAERCLYLNYINDTHSRMDVHRGLTNFLYTVKPREWRDFPH
jgi:hypothetical protein